MVPHPADAGAGSCCQAICLWFWRIATDFARFLRDQGDVQRARDLLAAVHGWFNESFEMPDLIDAKALLDELN